MGGGFGWLQNVFGGDGWINGFCVCVCVWWWVFWWCYGGGLVGLVVRKFTLWWLFLNLLVEYGFLWWFAW